MAEFEFSRAAVVAFAMVLVAVTVVMIADLRKRRVSNTIWLLFSLSGLLFHTLAPQGQGLEFVLVGSFLGFGLLFMPFLAGAIATRDLKLTAGVGAWFGPTLTIWVFVCIATVAALYHGLAFLGRSNLQDSLVGLRIMYCRLQCLLRYLATDDGRDGSPIDADLDERLVSYTTAIFVSTLFLLGVVLFIRS